MIFPSLKLLDNPKASAKITVIEGPDGVGKTTIVREAIKRFEEHGLELRVVRCPDNRGGAVIRDCIMSKELEENPSGQMFLFLADFLLGYEKLIKPYLDDPKIFFVLDRFIPSTCLYQHVALDYINLIMSEQFKDFTQAFSTARYVYLTPGDFDEHKKRLAQKKGDEVNHLDPVGDEAIYRQVDAYTKFAHHHRHNGLLGSKIVDIVEV